jgi:hypothetical protein
LAHGPRRAVCEWGQWGEHGAGEASKVCEFRTPERRDDDSRYGDEKGLHRFVVKLHRSLHYLSAALMCHLEADLEPLACQPRITMDGTGRGTVREASNRNVRIEIDGKWREPKADPSRDLGRHQKVHRAFPILEGIPQK